MLVASLLITGCVSEETPIHNAMVPPCTFQATQVSKCSDLRAGDRLDCSGEEKFVKGVYLKNYPKTSTNDLVVFTDDTSVACKEDNVMFSANEMSWGEHRCKVERCQ